MLTEAGIQEALKRVKYPGYSRDILSFGLVKKVVEKEGNIIVTMQTGTASAEAVRQIQAEVEKELKALPGVVSVTVEAGGAPASAAPSGAPARAPGAAGNPWAGQAKAPGVKRVVAVASGKGGVGKSTVSVNLACALTHLGAKVGLLDCDIYGPSIPLMMGCSEKPEVTENDRLVPPVSHGVKLMSIGFLIGDDQPVIWRGPMIVKTIQQFVGSVEWGELDYLLVDLPPGTGDAQLTLCQTVPLDGGVVVTTPQEASLGVVRKGIAMFQRVNVPILGIVENMSYFTTPTGDLFEIFGHGGGRTEAARQQTEFLGEVPIFTEIRQGGDQGVPVALSAPESAAGKAFMDIAKALRARLG